MNCGPDLSIGDEGHDQELCRPRANSISAESAESGSRLVPWIVDLTSSSSGAEASKDRINVFIPPILSSQTTSSSDSPNMEPLFHTQSEEHHLMPETGLHQLPVANVPDMPRLIETLAFDGSSHRHGLWRPSGQPSSSTTSYLWEPPGWQDAARPARPAYGALAEEMWHGSRQDWDRSQVTGPWATQPPSSAAEGSSGMPASKPYSKTAERKLRRQRAVAWAKAQACPSSEGSQSHAAAASAPDGSEDVGEQQLAARTKKTARRKQRRKRAAARAAAAQLKESSELSSGSSSSGPEHGG